MVGAGAVALLQPPLMRRGIAWALAYRAIRHGLEHDTKALLLATTGAQDARSIRIKFKVVGHVCGPVVSGHNDALCAYTWTWFLICACKHYGCWCNCLLQEQLRTVRMWFIWSTFV